MFDYPQPRFCLCNVCSHQEEVVDHWGTVFVNSALDVLRAWYKRVWEPSPEGGHRGIHSSGILAMCPKYRRRCRRMNVSICGNQFSSYKIAQRPAHTIAFVNHMSNSWASLWRNHSKLTRKGATEGNWHLETSCFLHLALPAGWARLSRQYTYPWNPGPPGRGFCAGS